jgi:hypothetical protein
MSRAFDRVSVPSASRPPMPGSRIPSAHARCARFPADCGPIDKAAAIS